MLVTGYWILGTGYWKLFRNNFDLIYQLLRGTKQSPEQVLYYHQKIASFPVMAILKNILSDKQYPVGRLSSVVCRRLSVVCCRLSVVGRLSSVVCLHL